MIIALEILLILSALVVIAAFVFRNGYNERFATRAKQRVVAYIETIRRTVQPQRLSEMSDVELTDTLMAAITRVRAQRHQRQLTLTLVAIAALGIALLLSAGQGPSAFVIAAVIGGICCYGIDRMFERRIQQWLKRQELDGDRLLID